MDNVDFSVKPQAINVKSLQKLQCLDNSTATKMFFLLFKQLISIQALMI